MKKLSQKEKLFGYLSEKNFIQPILRRAFSVFSQTDVGGQFGVMEKKKQKKMNLDKTLCIIYSIPSICVMIFFEKLKIGRIFIKYLSASIALLIIGIVVENYQENEQKSFSYFISQIMFSFLISQRIMRIPFRKKYHREPMLVRSVGTFEDKTYSAILLFIVVGLPFIINSFIVEKLFK